MCPMLRQAETRRTAKTEREEKACEGRASKTRREKGGDRNHEKGHKGKEEVKRSEKRDGKRELKKRKEVQEEQNEAHAADSPELTSKSSLLKFAPPMMSNNQ